MPGLKFRSLLVEDGDWLTETANNPEVAKYAISIYPQTENEISEFLRKDLGEGKVKHIVVELDGEPTGTVGISFGTGRDRHVAWLGIHVRRKHWGKGVGSGLMEEAIKLAKELGCRKLMLGTIEGNERAIRLYRKFGFQTEAYEYEGIYIDGTWRKGCIMGLELAPCEPRFPSQILSESFTSKAKFSEGHPAEMEVRQLMNRDLDEVHRLQNCPESTKSSNKIPPITKEETKKWYEELKSREGKYCLACFEGNKLLGYLRFTTSPLPFPSLKFKEIIVDVNQRPEETAEALIKANNQFRERYGYRKIFAYAPETSLSIINALGSNGFNKTGAMKCYYFIDGYYVDRAVFNYP